MGTVEGLEGGGGETKPLSVSRPAFFFLTGYIETQRKIKNQKSYIKCILIFSIARIRPKLKKNFQIFSHGSSR
jgi:hypothetical protein